MNGEAGDALRHGFCDFSGSYLPRSAFYVMLPRVPLCSVPICGLFFLDNELALYFTLLDIPTEVSDEQQVPTYIHDLDPFSPSFLNLFSFFVKCAPRGKRELTWPTKLNPWRQLACRAQPCITHRSYSHRARDTVGSWEQ